VSDRSTGHVGIIPAVQATTDVGSVAGGLRDIHETERLRPYLVDMWRRRGYVWYVASSEMRNRQIDNVLGNLWYLLTPALNIAVYFLIFGVLLGVDRGVDNFILFLTVGVFVFQYTQRSTTANATAIVGNIGLIKAFRFPRAILPVSTTLTETMATLASFYLVFVVAFLTGAPVRWQWVLLVPLLALQLVFTTGLALIVARATAHVRDVQQVLPFTFRMLFYGSGVIFNVSAYTATRPTAELLFTLNPMYCFVTLARWAVMGGDDATPTMLAIAAAWTVGIIVFGFIWFRAGEEVYGRD
jgi:teichoic acid transport system permease protein